MRDEASAKLAATAVCVGCQLLQQMTEGRRCRQCNRPRLTSVQPTDLDRTMLALVGRRGSAEELKEVRSSLSRHGYILLRSNVVKMALVTERMAAREPLIISSESGVGKSRLLREVSLLKATTTLTEYRENFASLVEKELRALANFVLVFDRDNTSKQKQLALLRNATADQVFQYLYLRQVGDVKRTAIPRFPVGQEFVVFGT